MPLWVLHRISDVFFFIAYYLIGYRKKVVKSNIAKAFPELNSAEQEKIAKGFYRNFCDVLVESIKAFSISEKEIKKRFVMKDVELLDKVFAEGKSVIGLISHVANYEWMIACDLYLKHRGVGIITPLSNKFLHRKIVESRSQFGTAIVGKADFKRYIAEENEPSVYFFGSDQSPHKATSAYWTKFFGVDTAVQYGAEKYAKKYNIPVYHFKISRLNRGYYQVECNLLEDNPTESPHGSILDRYCAELEDHIRNNASDWLWSHRRWKHSKPANG